MTVDDKHFKSIEEKINSAGKLWISNFNKACLDEAVKAVAPVLQENHEQSLPNKTSHKQSISRGA